MSNNIYPIEKRSVVVVRLSIIITTWCWSSSTMKIKTIIFYPTVYKIFTHSPIDITNETMTVYLYLFYYCSGVVSNGKYDDSFRGTTMHNINNNYLVYLTQFFKLFIMLSTLPIFSSIVFVKFWILVYFLMYIKVC